MRAIILTSGLDKAFSAGMDLNMIAGKGGAEDGTRRFALATSLAKMRAASAAEQAQKDGRASPDGMMGLGSNGLGADLVELNA